MSDENEIETQDQPESPRDVTERAFDALAGEADAGDDEREERAPAEAAAEDQEQAPERARDESGRYAKEKQKTGKSAARDLGQRAQAAGPEAAAAPPPRAAAASPVSQAPAFKAPSSWKPAAREALAKAAPEVQEEAVRVDREVRRVLQENAQLRQASSQYQELLRPYESAIRAQGQEPAKYLGSVLQSAHVIFNGPPQHRADALAEIIMNAGVPPELLDRALVARMQGRAPAPGAQQVGPQQFRDPRLDQLIAERQQELERRQSEESAAADERLATFAEKHQFYDDVQQGMADILEVWAKQGKKDVSEHDLERAYALACMNHPDVAPLFEQRRAAEAAAKARASTQRARAAAVSIRSTPTPDAPRERGKLSAKQITEQAWEDLEGRV